MPYYLNWDASTDEVGGSGLKEYIVYKDGIEQSPRVTTLWYSLGASVPTGCWSVSAIDNANNESSALTCINYSLQPPTNLTVGFSPLYVYPTKLDTVLNWVRPIDAGTITGYEIWRSVNDSTTNWVLIGTATTSGWSTEEYTDKNYLGGNVADTSSYYKIRSTNGTNVSEFTVVVGILFQDVI